MFDFVCEKEGQESEGEAEQWRKRYVHVCRWDVGCAGRRDASRRVASHRIVSRRCGQTDGGAAGNYVARTERPRNRNSCPRPPSPSSLRGIRILMSSFLPTCGRRSATCPRRILLQQPTIRHLVFTLPGHRRSRFRENIGKIHEDGRPDSVYFRSVTLIACAYTKYSEINVF